MKTDVNTLQLNEIFPRSPIPYLFVFLKKKISNTEENPIKSQKSYPSSFKFKKY
jgi:hypothetical protein